MIRLPGARRRKLASKLLAFYPSRLNPEELLPPSNKLRVVCVADTHNLEPTLPPGDILVHAGDLSENGKFDEIQAQLDWLALQPHQHKIVVAGNHDVLLDEAFLHAHPERRYGDSRTLKDLNWHDLVYLEDSSVSLDIHLDKIAANGDGGNRDPRTRTIKVFGSPYTPEYGVSAFQRPGDEDMWTSKIEDVDIIVCHGPPDRHLDKQGIHHAGDPYFALEIARVRPRLVVCGHIHASYGREDLLFNETLMIHDDIMRDWAGWLAVFGLGLRVFWTRSLIALRGRDSFMQDEKVTTLVNAAHGGAKKEPIVVDI